MLLLVRDTLGVKLVVRVCMRTQRSTPNSPLRFQPVKVN